MKNFFFFSSLKSLEKGVGFISQKYRSGTTMSRIPNTDKHICMLKICIFFFGTCPLISINISQCKYFNSPVVKFIVHDLGDKVDSAISTATLSPMSPLTMHLATVFDPSILRPAADKGVLYGIKFKNKIN